MTLLHQIVTSSMEELFTLIPNGTTTFSPSTSPGEGEGGEGGGGEGGGGGGSLDDIHNPDANLIMFVLWGIILPMIAALGLVGNILTMVVLWRREMHSTTILYLRALVVTDTGILIASVIFLTPLSCANYLRGSLDYFKHRVYPILHTPGYYLFMSLQQANVWILVAISVERYIAICHPFQASRLITRRKTITVLVGISVASAIYNIPHLFATHPEDCHKSVRGGNSSNTLDAVSSQPPTNHNSYNNNNNDNDSFNGLQFLFTSPPSTRYVSTGSAALVSSSSPWPLLNNNSNSHLRELPDYCLKVVETNFGLTAFYHAYRSFMYGAVLYVVPFLALLILNSFLIKELMIMQRRRTGTDINEENEANLSFVLVLIVIVFILCQTPGLVNQFDIHNWKSKFSLCWLAFSNVLITTNSAVNFLIYTAFGRKFRRVLFRVFRRFFKKNTKSASHSTYAGFPYTVNDCEMSSVGENNMPSLERRASERTESTAIGVKESSCGGGGVGGGGGGGKTRLGGLGKELEGQLLKPLQPDSQEEGEDSACKENKRFLLVPGKTGVDDNHRNNNVNEE